MRPSPGLAQPCVVGANHRSSTVELRDRLFVDAVAAPAFFARLRERGIRQAILLSTCDRVEIQMMHEHPQEAAEGLRALLTEAGGAAAMEEQLYTLFDEAATRHIFAVAASLDSQVIGEPQVLGQVKEAHRLAQEHGMVGPELEALLQAAFGAAKRVRSETGIVRGPVSIASAAVQVARDLHGALAHRTALVVGLGEMGDLMLRQLRAAGLVRVLLAGQSRRIEAAARRLAASTDCHFVALDTLDRALAEADVVITAAGTGQYIISAPMVECALKARRQRPVLLLDGGVPPDVEPAIDLLDGAFLYTLDDLERAALNGRARRVSAAEAAWLIVDSAVGDWQRRRAERAALPELLLLRRRFEDVREEVLAEHPDADAAEATRRLVNRLLHAPSRTMREAGATGSGSSLDDPAALHRLIRRLFGLSHPAGGAADSEE